MSTTPEAELAAELIICREDRPCISSDKIARLIDTAFAEHRERVARLIEVATTAARCLPEWSSSRREISDAIASMKEHHDPVA